MIKSSTTLLSIIFVLVFALFAHDVLDSLQVWSIEKKPPTDWVEYYSVEAEKDSYALGENMYVISDLEVKKDVRLQWSDVLFCDFDNRIGTGFDRFVEFSSTSAQVERGRRRISRPWRYATQLPDTPATCFIKSCTIVNLEWISPKTRCLDSKNIRFE